MNARMSDSEAIMWAVEKDPALRSDFCNLTVLDSAPDPDRLRVKIGDALAAIPRLGQRDVSPRGNRRLGQRTRQRCRIGQGTKRRRQGR